MSQDPPLQPLQRLVLVGMQHQGHALAFSWQWPDSNAKVGFDEVLGGVQHVDPELLQNARHCTLQQVGPADQPVWLLGNSSQTLVCSVNQQLLSAGSQVRLDHGDEIELGLTRFAVSLHSSHVATEVLDAEPLPVDTSEEALANFDLTDLDALADISTLSAGERYGVNRSDFSDLISIVPDEQGVSEVTPDLAKPVVTEPSLAEALEAGTEPAYAQKVSALLEQFSAGAEKPKVAADEDNELFAALHTKYLEKLRNPSHGDEEDHWQAILRGGQSSQPDPMQQWMKAAGTSHSLDDLLGQPHSIASVIQGLDPLGASDVLAPEPFDSVMHLFAPEHLRVPATDSLESLVQRSLPGLTRREHHSLSLDSAMPFTGGEDPPTKSKKNGIEP